jgi:hypothetical protein
MRKKRQESGRDRRRGNEERIVNCDGRGRGRRFRRVEIEDALEGRTEGSGDIVRAR